MTCPGIEIPANPVVRVSSAGRVVRKQIECHHVGHTIAVDVCDGDASAHLRTCNRAALNGVCPRLSLTGAWIYIPANAVIIVTDIHRVIDMEGDQVGSAIAVDICDGNASAIIIAAIPARDLKGICP